jgi:hypothetical protein
MFGENWGKIKANKLIGATSVVLGDYFLENILGIFSKNSSKKSLQISLYYFVKVCVKNLPKICHFQSFPSPFTSPFIV